ncbi:hypothetical protein PVAND_009561 [Polypedilum vanderplanki]|uniref:Rhodanese domain-containing protein n=1 Tax=Polypedilum vanderplanki TaxID=319348 RepID=A0A9J6CD48_POLVA|nr:hypothetical protein PVAND_009561 [Polypedilum vanderplanki]
MQCTKLSISVIRSFSRLSLIRGTSVAVSNRFSNKNYEMSYVNKIQNVTALKYRLFSSEADIDLNKFATYEQIKDLPNHPEKLLIDVREPNELKETGVIPTSINIPLNEVADKLAITNEEFKKIYNREKPNFETEIIFHCKIGMRSQKAAELLRQIGFKNVKNYKGSWLEWAEKEGLNK